MAELVMWQVKMQRFDWTKEETENFFYTSPKKKIESIWTGDNMDLKHPHSIDNLQVAIVQNFRNVALILR